MITLQFTKSFVSQFRHTNKNLRYGQAFYDFAELRKITSEHNKSFCDRLYNADDGTARQMIMSITVEDGVDQSQYFNSAEEAAAAAADQNFERDVRVGLEPNVADKPAYLDEARNLLEDFGENYRPEFPDHRHIKLRSEA